MAEPFGQGRTAQNAPPMPGQHLLGHAKDPHPSFFPGEGYRISSAEYDQEGLADQISGVVDGKNSAFEVPEDIRSNLLSELFNSGGVGAGGHLVP